MVFTDFSNSWTTVTHRSMCNCYNPGFALCNFPSSESIPAIEVCQSPSWEAYTVGVYNYKLCISHIF